MSPARVPVQWMSCVQSTRECNMCCKHHCLERQDLLQVPVDRSWKHCASPRTLVRLSLSLVSGSHRLLRITWTTCFHQSSGWPCGLWSSMRLQAGRQVRFATKQTFIPSLVVPCMSAHMCITYQRSTSYIVACFMLLSAFALRCICLVLFV